VKREEEKKMAKERLKAARTKQKRRGNLSALETMLDQITFITEINASPMHMDKDKEKHAHAHKQDREEAVKKK
jgi:hypothetical protein